MLNDLFNITSQQMSNFSDTVRDAFGQSIISDVFEPLLQNIFYLQQMQESFLTKSATIDRFIEELRSIGNQNNGQ